MTVNPRAIRKRKTGGGCGTPSGYKTHLKRGETPCGPCRQANTAYQRDFRSRRADVYAEEKRRNRARTRATWRLVNRHHDEWQALVFEELDKR